MTAITPQDANAVVAPVAPQERIETLDILRGFALFCILVVNWSVNTLWDVDAYAGWTSGPDRIAYWTIKVFLDNKSWPMFAFLFGLGFALQMQRGEARHGHFLSTYSRRLAVLFLIGVAHFILTERTILWQYATYGFLLLSLRRLNPNLLVVLALAILLIPWAQGAVTAYDRQLRLAELNQARMEITVDADVLDRYVGAYELESMPYTMFVTRKANALFAQSPGYPGDADIPTRLAATSATEFFSRKWDRQISFVRDSTGNVTGLMLRDNGEDVAGRLIQGGQAIDNKALRRVAMQGPRATTYATGAFGQIVSLRARLFWEAILGYRPWLSDVFAVFLLGLYAGHGGFFHQVPAHQRFIRKVMWLGLALGLAGATFAAMMRPGSPFLGESVPFTMRALGQLGEQLGSPILGLAYIAALTLLLQREVWKKRFAPLGAVGRMALTNYLLQSVAYVLLFFSYGLGWYGQVGAFGGVMLTLPVFALQIVGSQWWLRRFRFGPAEWLWRSATYWKWQPMRLERPAFAAGVAGAK